MAYTTKQKALINSQLKMEQRGRLLTKSFVGIKKKKTGRYVQIFKDRATGKREEFSVPKNYLDFKLKVAKAR